MTDGELTFPFSPVTGSHPLHLLGQKPSCSLPTSLNYEEEGMEEEGTPDPSVPKHVLHEQYQQQQQKQHHFQQHHPLSSPSELRRRSIDDDFFGFLSTSPSPSFLSTLPSCSPTPYTPFSSTPSELPSLFISSSPVVTTAASTSLDRFMLLQRSTGSWPCTDQFARHIGKSLDEIKVNIPAEILGCSDKDSVWAASLAITYLEQRFPQKRREWESLALLSFQWIKKQLEQNTRKVKSSSLSVEQLLNTASKFISQPSLREMALQQQTQQEQGETIQDQIRKNSSGNVVDQSVVIPFGSMNISSTQSDPLSVSPPHHSANSFL